MKLPFWSWLLVWFDCVLVGSFKRAEYGATGFVALLAVFLVLFRPRLMWLAADAQTFRINLEPRREVSDLLYIV